MKQGEDEAVPFLKEEKKRGEDECYTTGIKINYHSNDD